MAKPRVEVTERNAKADIARLAEYRTDSANLEPKYQHFIAELILLRLFAVLEMAVEDIACKLVAGANYANGNVPDRLITSRSVSDAHSKMRSYQRQRPINFLRWTKAQFIAESTEHVLNPSDAFMINARMHGNLLNEMRKVRNFVAHKSTRARREYMQIVGETYSSTSKIPPGPFLVSDRRHTPPKIDYYLVASQLMISDLIKGY